ncbi:adenosylcobinamide-GDP ribazoletransferase [Arenicella sp. 4NH20-0111]|uniref:adenosylcobinamide-GDP ribazoletransferase n=1 Tax=Arenicella sp. 4NH20-0111 TaxID=3127648 RepID=UPI0031070085
MTLFNHHEKTLFYTALMFYTRIRVPVNTPYSEDLLAESRKYFTSIGLVIGAIACTTFLFFQLFLPLSISVMLSMISTVLATGAFHEDGFADSCDGFGGGWNANQVLTIMKDSRIGTYGTVALIGILSVKFGLLYELATISPAAWCLCTLSAHTVSRQHSSRVIEHHQYVQDIDKSKVKPIANKPLTHAANLFSNWVALAPCLLLALYSIEAVIIGMVSAYWASKILIQYSAKRIGGYTGDVLGAIQQVTEVLFLLVCVALI